MMFGQQPYVYQQPIYNQPPMMQEPMMRPQYQPAPSLWDMNAPVVYVKKADASGKPAMTTYDLVERSTAPVSPTAPQTVPTVEYVTRKDFDELAAKVAALSVKPVRKMKEAENESTV